MSIYTVIHMRKFNKSSKIYHSKIHIVNIFEQYSTKTSAENVSRAGGWVNHLLPWWSVYRQTSGTLQVRLQTTAIEQVTSLGGLSLLPTGVYTTRREEGGIVNTGGPWARRQRLWTSASFSALRCVFSLTFPFPLFQIWVCFRPASDSTDAAKLLVWVKVGTLKK